MQIPFRFTLSAFNILAIVALAPALATEPATLRLMTYNVHHCEGSDGKLDVERIAKVIQDQNCDLVALQELDRNTARSKQVDQLEVLAKLTGMQPFFGKSIDHAGGEYGVGVLSRLPVSEHKTTKLPSGAKREQRVALEVVVQPREGEKFVFVSTHLDHSSGEHDREKQTAQLFQMFSSGERQAILAGDFNAPTSRPEIATLLQKWTDVDSEKLSPTIPVTKPTVKIDYIFLPNNSPWQVVAVEVLHEPIASDHLPLVATVRAKQ